MKKLSKTNSLFLISSCAFYVLFLGFIFYGIIIKAIFFYSKSYSSHHSIYHIAFTFLFFIFVCFIGCRLSSIENSKAKWVIIPVFIFVASMLMRYIIINSMGIDTNQVSDFNSAFINSQVETPPDFYRIFSNWLLYVKYLQIFADTPLQGIVMNALLTSVSSVLIYCIMLLYQLSTRPAIIAALLFACWPAHLFYTILLSPEFVNIFLVLVAIGLIKLSSGLKNKWFVYMIISIAAITLAISGFFKGIDIIVLIALAITLVLNFLKDKIYLQSPKIYWTKYILTPLLVIVVFFAAKQTVYVYMDHYAAGEVNRDFSPHFVYIGLNPETMGSYSPEVAGVYSNYVRENNFDYDKAKELTYAQLASEINEHQNLTFQDFDKKIDRAWSNNNYLYFVDSTMNENNNSAFNVKYWLDAYAPAIQLYYIAIAVLCFIGAIFALLRGESELVLLSSLIVFGFALLLLIGENQPRYKCVVYPYMAIIAGYGADRFINMLNQKLVPVFAIARKNDTEKI